MNNNILGIKKGEYRDCTKRKGTSVGCKCIVQSLCLACSVKKYLQQITMQTFYNISVYACTHEKNLIPIL